MWGKLSNSVREKGCIESTRIDRVPNNRAKPDRHANTPRGEEHNPDREKNTAGSLLTRHRTARPHTTLHPPKLPPPAPLGRRTPSEAAEPAPCP
jgi:hypothetical protein